MNNALMFSKASDEWSTPQDFFDALDAEFHFVIDAAANKENRKCSLWLGPGSMFEDALERDWAWLSNGDAIWLNPPYSRCKEFMAKAAQAAMNTRQTVVCLVPSRTDTKWWHEHVWDGKAHQPRQGVEIRFIRGRLKFGEGKNSAPFPSAVIIFRGQ